MTQELQEDLLPLFPLPVVLYPDMHLPLHVFEARYREMIGFCLETATEFGVTLAREESIASVGCSAAVLKVVKEHPNGEFDILSVGVRRFEIEEVVNEKAYLQAFVRYIEDSPSTEAGETSDIIDAKIDEIFAILGVLVRRADAVEKLRKEVDMGRGCASYIIADKMGFDLEDRQRILELCSELERLDTILEILARVSETVARRSRPGEMTSGANGKHKHA